MDHSDLHNGPHYDADLILPNGKLARLHKGAPKPPPPVPPPVRKTAQETAEANDTERKKTKKRKGYGNTLLDSSSQGGSQGNNAQASLLG